MAGPSSGTVYHVNQLNQVEMALKNSCLAEMELDGLNMYEHISRLSGAQNTDHVVNWNLFFLLVFLTVWCHQLN